MRVSPGAASLLVALALLAGGCQCGRRSTGRCVAGTSVACPCTNGRTGAQACGTGGSYAPCVCVAPDAAPVPDRADAAEVAAPVDAASDRAVAADVAVDRVADLRGPADAAGSEPAAARDLAAERTADAADAAGAGEAGVAATRMQCPSEIPTVAAGDKLIRSVALDRTPGARGYALVGEEGLPGQPQSIWVARHNGSGAEIWKRTHSGPATAARMFNNGYGVAVGPDGEVVAAGSSAERADDPDLWLRKYDAQGNVQWSALHAGGGKSSEGVQGVVVAPNGDVIAAGGERAAEDLDVWLARYDAQGKQLWKAGYAGRAPAQHDLANAVALDSDGNIVVAGYAVGGAGQPLRPWVGKYEGGGKEIWTKAPDLPAGATGGHARAVVADPRLGIVISGDLVFLDGEHGFVARLDAGGNLQWLEQSPALNGKGLAVAQGTIYAVGWTRTPGGDEDDGWLGRLDDNGRLTSAIACDSGGGRQWFYGVAVGSDYVLAAGLRLMDGRFQPYVVRFPR